MIAANSILLVTTGGTIDKVYFDSKGGYAVGAPIVRRILQQAQVTSSYSVLELMRKDSLDMTAADRGAIRDAIAQCEASRVVVTHGTDTMVVSAKAFTGIAGKTIVLTGALQPGLFSDSDAAFNLGMAVAAAQILPEGVYIAANGHVFVAGQVRKNFALNRFEAISDQP
jgi:L-asparaginase